MFCRERSKPRSMATSCAVSIASFQDHRHNTVLRFILVGRVIDIKTPSCLCGLLRAPRRIPPMTVASSAWNRHEWTSRLGISLLLGLASVWTTFLAILNVAPNATANYLMNTAEFDEGDFWQLSASKTSAEEMSGVVGLAIIAVMYALLACWSLVRIEKITVASRLKVIQSLHQRASTLTSKIRLDRPWTQFLRFRSRHRRRGMVMLEVVEVSLQVVTLRNLLLRGHQLPLIFVYVVLVFINCSTTFYFVSIDWKRDFFDEMAVDAILDMCFAVFFPAIQLTYAIKTFRGDFEMLRIRQQYFPAKPFERRGRIYGDPEQMSIFSTTIEGLRLRTAGDVANVLLFNFLTCVRWGSIIRIVRKKMRKITESPDAKAISPACVNSVIRKPSAASKPTHTQVSARTVPSIVGTLFLFTGIVLSVLTAKAVNTSTLLCDSFVSSCPVYAYHWLGEDTKAACPCLVFISQSINPTFEELVSPPDIMTNLSILAEAGTLRTIQIINRGIAPELPPAVQNCVHLQQLILINAQVIRMPNWTATTFANLEYLQIEGVGEFTDLMEMPDDLFSRMASLRTLILSNHPFLSRLPSFGGLSNVETIFLGQMYGIRSLPPTNTMKKLHTMALSELVNLYQLPELEDLQATLKSIYIQLTSLCCNGYFTNGVYSRAVVPCVTTCLFAPGACYNDTTPSEIDGDDTIQRVDPWPLPTMEMLVFMQPFRDDFSVCDSRLKLPTRLGKGDKCNGVMYRNCDEDGTTGGHICYNAELGRPACLFDPLVIEMRRDMIRRGFACDAVEEGWLGCKAKPSQ